MSRFIKSPPGKYSITKYRFYASWNEHFRLTIHGLLSEIANTFLSSLDCITLFLKIIYDFFNFLTATGSFILFHLHNLTSPNAPRPITFIDLKSKMDILLRSWRSIMASSWVIFFLSCRCSEGVMFSACIFWFNCSQYYFFCCYCWIILEYRCSMKLLAA